MIPFFLIIYFMCFSRCKLIHRDIFITSLLIGEIEQNGRVYANRKNY
jgi:hypothetical protein